jgi:hypothetical protein
MKSQRPDEIDAELLRRYRSASAALPAAPSEEVRHAILSEGRRVAQLNKLDQSAAPQAAKRPYWKFAAFGTLSAAVLAGFLIFPRFRDSAETAAPVAVRKQPMQPARQAPAAAPSAPPALKETQDFAKTEAAPESRVASRPAFVKRRLEEVGAGLPGAGLPGAGLPGPSEPGSGLATADSSVTPAAAEARAAAAPSLRAGAQKSVVNAPADGRVEGNDSLLSAVQSGELSKIVSLLDRGAAVDQQDEGGRSPLMLATIQGRLDAVQLLLDRGADPNAADRAGRTPLQEAKLHGFTEIERLLVRAGAH